VNNYYSQFESTEAGGATAAEAAVETPAEPGAGEAIEGAPEESAEVLDTAAPEEAAGVETSEMEANATTLAGESDTIKDSQQGAEDGNSEHEAGGGQEG